MLCVQQQAKLDCFKEPSAFCECYKCTTHWDRVNSELDYFEKIYEDKVQAEILEPGSVDDMKPKSLFTVQSTTMKPKSLFT